MTIGETTGSSGRSGGALDRLLAPFGGGGVDDRSGDGAPRWLRSGDWQILARPCVKPVPPGEEVERFALEGGGSVAATRIADGSVVVPFSLDEALENYLSERWRAAVRQKALSRRQLSLFYRVKRLIPRRAQLAGRRLLMRWQGLPEFPAWPIDDSVARLVWFYARCLLLASGTDALEFRWFWPGSYRAALVLSHDVESAQGLRLAVEIADLEEERGLRSSFNLVASDYPIDDGIVRELRERGFELGVHGVHHDASLFSRRETFEQQQPALRRAVELLGADGFRSPATHRVFEWLGELPVSYDCSMPHSDPFEPQPGGCCALWPFFVGDIVELPYTLPQDHTLFTLLGHRSIGLWVDALDRIERRNGLAQFLTHPDPGYLGNPSKRVLYVELLDVISERDYLWRPLPRAVAAWWRQRDERRSDPWPAGRGLVRTGERPGEIELQAPGPQRDHAEYL